MPQADLSLSIAQRVDAACDRFESQWRAGKRPRIEDHLTEIPDALHEEILRALIPVELELLAREGSAPTESDYHPRFPKHVKLISEVFAALKSTNAGVGDTSVSYESVRTGPAPAKSPTATQVGPAPLAARIGRFQVMSVLGEGAFGRVYRAKDPQLGRDVAIKVPFDRAVQTEADRERFLREARAAAGIHHPNICPVHEVGEADGKPYIVMAMIPGESLSAIIKSRKQPLPEKQAAVIIRKLALALEAAHQKGVVHRDLKPANVMFDKERKEVVVTDFGLARGPQLTDAVATQSGVIMGTPAYMSPEQARGSSKSVGPAADIYSLGVILYELLAGCRPYAGSITEVIGQILHVEPAPPSKHRKGIDPRLEAACLKAIAKDPAARFATMKEFATAMDAILRTPTGPTIETAKAADTRKESEESIGTDTRRLADIFAALSAERQEETERAVERAVRKARTPRWVFVVTGLVLVGGLTAIAGLVFFTKSDKVKVTIELTDVDLSDKSLSFFLDDEPISAEALANPIELKPGEYVLVVKRGKEIVKRLNLSVSGGRSPGIKVKDITPPPVVIPPKKNESIPPPKISPSPKSDNDPGRVAALKVIAIKGRVEIEVNAGRSEIAAVKDLPEGAFKLVGIYLPWEHDVAAAGGLGFLKTLPDLRRLKVSYGKLAAGDLEAIASLTNLEYLEMFSIVIKNADLAHLGKLVNLQELDLGNNPIGAGLLQMPGLSKMRVLHLYRTAVADADLAVLANMTDLKAISVEQTQVTGKGFDGLPRHTKLESVNAHACPLNAEGVAAIAKLPALKTLWAHHSTLDDDALARLADAPALADLRLDGCKKITDAGVLKLAKLKTLTSLNLEQTAISNEAIQQLQNALPKCKIAPEIKDLGFVPLFNGKDLAGWEATRAESFSVDAEGNLVAAGDTLGSMQWLVTTKDYSEYVLRLEFLIVKGPPTHTNSGVAIRAAPGQTGENGAKLRVQIRNDVNQKPRSGAVVYTGADYIEPSTPPTPKPAGEWNTMEIEVRGAQIKVSMNGQPANDVDLSKIDRGTFTQREKGYAIADLDRKTGRVGFQSFRGEIKFRNIRIKELALAVPNKIPPTKEDKTPPAKKKEDPPKNPAFPETKTFFEDFSKTKEGDRPADWKGDDAISVRKQGDRPRLEVAGKGLRNITLPAVSIGKNFFLECEFAGASDGAFELLLQGHNGGKDFPISAVAAGGFGVYGATLQKISIPEVDPKASKTQSKPIHRLRLEREGDIFRLKVNAETIHARRLPGYGGFSGVQLGLSGGDAPTTRFYWIRIGTPADSPREDSAPADAEKTFRQGFRSDFQKAVEGDLPAGWKGDAAVAVRKGDGERARLELGGKGPNAVTTPDIAIEGNFFCELEFTVSSGAPMEVTLEGRSGDPDLSLNFRGSGGFATYGASLQEIRLPGLDPKTSKTQMKPEHRLRLEREGEVYRVVVDGETIHAQRLSGFKGFARVRLNLANAEAPPTRIFGIKVGPLG